MRSPVLTLAEEDGSPESDIYKGTIEGGRPEDEQQANRDVPALDAEGLPNKRVSSAEERIGANADDDEVARLSDRRAGTS